MTRDSCSFLKAGGPVLLAALLAGCSKPPPPAALPQLEALSLRGVAEVAFVPDPAAPPLELPPDEEIRRPSPTSIRSPLYPAAAMEAGCGNAVIGLRLIVNPDGVVAEVRESPVVRSTSGECGRWFREESESAARDWRFVPALWRKFGPGKDLDEDYHPDYQVMIAEEAIPVYLDVRIEFLVINGEGRVKLRI